MTCPALLERELRSALRRKAPVRRRGVVASLFVAGALLFLLFAWWFPGPGVGRRLHLMFCLVGAVIVLRIPTLAAGAFAEERGDQTLGLLFLSGLGPLEVFAGKALSAALISWADLLALFPLLALPFLIGGVSSELFFATVVALPGVMLFALALTLLASVLSVAMAVVCLVQPATPPKTAGTPIEQTLAMLKDVPGQLPSGWRLRLMPDHRPRLDRDVRIPLPVTVSGLVAELSAFLLELSPWLELFDRTRVWG